MKLRKKIAIVGLAVTIVSTGAILAYSTSDTTTTEATKTVAVSKVDKIPIVETQKIEAETKTVAAPEQEEALEVAPKRVVAEKPAEPKVLSTQEYANQYLNVSTEGLQECFDAIVAEWPERFVPEVRERNVKGLQGWASLCATGIKSSFTRHTSGGLIYLYGENGEFFDSPQAKAYW